MIIFRYLAKEVYAITLAATLVLFFLFVSNQLIHYLYFAAAGRLTSKLAFELLLFKAPVLLGLLLPLSLYLAILLAYGRLYADNEMTVLFACGVSKAKLLKITIAFSLVIAIISSLLMMWIGPPFNKHLQFLFDQGAASPTELITPGHFQSINNDQFVFYTEKTSKNHNKLYNVFVTQQSQQDNNDKQGILSAEEAYQTIDPKTGDSFVVFKNGNRYVGTPGQKDYQIIKFQQYWLRIKQNAGAREYDKDTVPTLKLFSDHSNYGAAELQWRFSMPLMAIILAFLAVPLSQVKTRQGRYAQLIPAILLYVIYSNFMMLSRGWIRSGTIPHYLGMWWIHLLIFTIAIILNVRQIGWKQLLRIFTK